MPRQVFTWLGTDLVTAIASQPCKIRVTKLYRCVVETKMKAKFEDGCGLTMSTEYSCNNVVMTTEYS